ncbi:MULTISPECIES: filament integrity protein FraC [unclassified Leptolyngbya]|uniref:filament integrity protein FraC n=1 Tax=unclassified Leptolyngbya TaxID=2650499 RepID=UPI001689714F|nr:MULTISPECIES: filament integrity protein FraC [unclassified Leptolyngbya]MBD1910602.1 hypothetical protein [Leptolyngbya sp. FACHB-8]MBD2154542.1 hypothetical protein [Leptolyngbya sp. FACHB-16]
MVFPVLALRMIAFQFMFLLLAIAIEGVVLKRELAMIPRKAMLYATILNLTTTVVGWFIFFAVEAVLPQFLRNELIEFILFNRWTRETAFWGILVGFLTFFASFVMKTFGFTQLEQLLLTQQEWEAQLQKRMSERRLGRRFRRGSGGWVDSNNQARAMLTANACSYSAITVILFTRYLLLNPQFSGFGYFR